MTDEPTIPDDVKEAMESVAKKAFDAGHAAGAEGTQEFFQYNHPSGLTRQRDVAYENYEAELKPLLAELRSEGVRNLKGHPRVKALEKRYGR